MNTDPSTHIHNDPQAPVIVLTPAAVEKVKMMMQKENKPEHGLRVGVIAGGCAGMSYELRLQKAAYENDLVLEQNGLKIFVNEESVPFIKNLEIDYLDTLKESGFKYRNPNAKSSCGCGTSFS